MERDTIDIRIQQAKLNVLGSREYLKYLQQLENSPYWDLIEGAQNRLREHELELSQLSKGYPNPEDIWPDGGHLPNEQ